MPPRRRPHRLLPPVRAARALGVLSLTAALLAGCGSAVDSTGDSTGDTAGTRPPTTSPAPAPAPADDSPRTVATAPGFLGPVEERARPERLRIDSIGVDVDVVPVGVDGAGDAEVPPPALAGWYEFGPYPGEPGSSVLLAHVDYDGRPGAFFRLRDVAPGDRVEVVGSDGAVLGLRVTEVARVPKEGLAASGAFDRAGPPRVALVTCGGEFDRARRSYEDNVVAWAEPAS